MLVWKNATVKQTTAFTPTDSAVVDYEVYSDKDLKNPLRIENLEGDDRIEIQIPKKR